MPNLKFLTEECEMQFESLNVFKKTKQKKNINKNLRNCSMPIHCFYFELRSLTIL